MVHSGGDGEQGARSSTRTEVTQQKHRSSPKKRQAKHMDQRLVRKETNHNTSHPAASSDHAPRRLHDIPLANTASLLRRIARCAHAHNIVKKSIGDPVLQSQSLLHFMFQFFNSGL